MIEEDLFFPGRPPDSPSLPRTPTPVPASCPATPPSSIHHLHNEHNANDKRTVLQHGSSTTANTAASSPLIYLSSPSSTMGSASMLTLPTSIRNTDTVDLSCIFDSLHSDGSRPASVAPLNPRDHSLLEHIYTEMHASRFINLSPLSLLANSLPVYFKSELFHSLLWLDYD
jgi:hypothetical protein